MPVQRQILETVARCVGVMVYYRNVEQTEETTDAMAAELRAIVGWMLEMGLCGEAVEEHICDPVRHELTARYGPSVASGLYADFADAIAAARVATLVLA